MSWITQCPHCKTRFRIHQEQLDVRRGLVCCGRCQHAFNAREQLFPNADIDHPKEPSDGQDAISSPLMDGSNQPSAIQPNKAIPENIAITAISPTIAPNIASSAQLAPPEAALEIQTQPPPAPSDIPALANSNSPWWIAGVLGLSLMLLLQLGYSFRVVLIARAPMLEPIFATYCKLAGCTIELPQQAELLLLETSGLEAIEGKGNQIELSALIRNRANFSQTYPSLQLALTNQQDTVIARRSFAPEDYLPTEMEEKKGIGAGQILEVHTPLDINGLAPVGYKLLLFYPHSSAKI
ncbi:DUF3426 domain-containing protein [Ferriphaselus amnicola]|nr:DUF3426 domain-containing protein [Ferriphaselus amnicola]